ncbi:MAG: hypothetical protein M3R55_17715, partial [Acidobacteriota bacterium]|nr:hypothetical protein [Acidobacteriota bacterium]
PMTLHAEHALAMTRRHFFQQGALGLGSAALLARSRHRDDPGAWAWPMAAALVCAPMVYPWYMVWLAPFFISALAAPFMIWSVTILGVYRVWYLYPSTGRWSVPIWILVLEYTALAAAVALVIWRTRRASRATAP